MRTAGSGEQVRVLLVGLPGMLRSIVREALSQQPDIRIIGHAERLDDAVSAGNADIVLSTIASVPQFKRASTVLAAGPEPAFIGITPDGRHVAVFQRDLSPDDLVSAVRSAAHTSDTAKLGHAP